MDLELVTVGTELLLGFTVDTNAAELGRALAAAGIRVVGRATVGDDPAAIRRAVGDALARTGAVLTTGGLGPTRDDLTKHAVAELFDAPLEFLPEVWAAVEDRFRRLGRTPAASNRSQAEVPRGAVALPNPRGTAPGLWLEGRPGLVIMLPGVPSEMRGLLRDEVLPRLSRRAGAAPVLSAQLRTTGLSESGAAERLAGAEEEVAPLTLAYLPGAEGVDLRLTAWRLPQAEAEERLAHGIERLRASVGDYAYGTDDADLAGVVLDALRARGLRLAVAESCTGGLVGARLTAIPGSSDVFVGGVIAYDNRIKQEQLGVAPDLLRTHGAVSEPVARAMAAGVAEGFGVGAAIAVTGIAGPDGGSDEKPVGTVWLAVALDGAVTARLIRFPGDRAEVRARAAQAALFLLARRLDPR